MWRLLSPNKVQGWKHPPAPPVLHSHLNHWAGRGAAGSDIITNPQENNCRSKGPEKEGRAGDTQGRGWRGGQGRERTGQEERELSRVCHRKGNQRGAARPEKTSNVAVLEILTAVAPPIRCSADPRF